MPIRNPFARRPGAPAAAVQDENSRPGSAAGTGAEQPAHPGFERVDTIGSKASSALSIRSARSQDNGEYKMSVVNDSGIYLPPSPTEKEATWPRRYLSRTSTDTRSTSDYGEIEHFSISRESFDSYRRSFDICAKSPIAVSDAVPARQSLDSARFPRLPRPRYAPPTPEESFEDVGLNDDKQQPAQQGPQRRRNFFKFGSEHGAADGVPVLSQPGAMSRFLMLSRKRAQSGQGSELGAMPAAIEGKEMTEVQVSS